MAPFARRSIFEPACTCTYCLQSHLWFEPTNVGIWKTGLATELGKHGQALKPKFRDLGR